ncbi:hypothetical protein BA895_04840 [Humibacillus sp. DSM 29435]|nr:hypothetical protein BA895_04840 [Humibacillus sp. DSM 29435]
MDFVPAADLTPVAFARHGVFSSAWAAAAGLDSDAVGRLVRSGRAHPLVRGWYAVGPPGDERDRHRLAATAAYLRLGGRARVSHHSSLVFHGLPLYRADLATVHLTRTGPGSSRNRPGVKVHPSLPMDGAADRVPIAVGIVQSGLEADPLTALVAADAALHRRSVTSPEIEDAVNLLSGRHGIGPVRAVLAGADTRIESPGESVLGHRLRALGWAVTPQFMVVTDLGTRYADFRIDGTRVLVEFDGKVKYGGERGADVLFAEKRREDALRRRGWLVERFVWAEIERVPLIERRIEAAVATAARLGWA